MTAKTFTESVDVGVESGLGHGHRNGHGHGHGHDIILTVTKCNGATLPQCQ
jgi:hypothetical protein